MADSLHLALSAFRDTMLTAVARLEFAIRDSATGSVETRPSLNHEFVDLKEQLHQTLNSYETLKNSHTTRMNTLEKEYQNLQEQVATLLKATEETKELLKIPAPAPSTTRNVLISTPALAAAVAAVTVQPSEMVLDDDSESEVGEGQLRQEENVVEEKGDQEDVEMEVEAEAEDEEEEDDSPDLRQVMIKGKQYFMDAENSVYVETDEGYEEIGKYNSALDCIEGAEGDSEDETEVEEEEEEEEEEEGVEVEEFLYKGKTYQRDSENNVYDDGEQIGTWNGKKIIPLA
jgi:hypothetical protein